MERTQLIEHIFRQFDTDGGDSLSFKEFALALWTFASLDVAGIGRFTYEIYKNEERDGIDGQGVNEFLSGVFGRKGSANAGRARNELETLRRAEGGVIDRYDFEEFIETNAKSSLGPLVRMHRATFSAAEQRGCLAGVLQGRPVEPSSPYLLHLESSHLMSTAALDALLAALLRLDAPRLGGAGAAMVQLAERAYGRISTYFGRVQLGFGLLLREAGV